jgi:hypothetical protein
MPTSNANSFRLRFTPNTEPLNIENGNVVDVYPKQQHRKSRSLSEVWLEYRPQGTVQAGKYNTFFHMNFICDTETLLQPKFHKKVSTQQAPTKEEVVRTTKYVLTNLDAQGDIVTDVVKVN